MKFKSSRATAHGERNYRNETHHVGERKRLRKEAQRQSENAGCAMVWLGGVLHFAGTLTPVAGVKPVPKPGRVALGLSAARFERQPKKLSWAERAAIEDAEDRRRNGFGSGTRGGGRGYRSSLL